VRDGGCALHLRDVHQLASDQRTAEGGGHRRAVRVERVRLQRVLNVAAHELLTRVDHMAARRAERQRALTHFDQLASLPEVQRDSDDFGAVLFFKPRNSERSVKPARICQYDTLHIFQPGHSRGTVTGDCHF
jgi:hypothetical protein